MVDATSINGIPVVGTGANGQILFRDGANLAWHAPGWVPTVTPPPPPPTTVYGWDITEANTGPRVAMAVYAGTHWASDFAGSASAKNFSSGTVFQDVNNGVYNDCQFGETFQNALYNNPASGTVLNYCDFIANNGVGPYGIGDLNYTLYRCLVKGFSDGVRCNGGNTIIRETLIRCALADASDHNDGVQAVGGNGSVLLDAVNIDMRPVSGSLNVNACVQLGDFSAGAVFRGTIQNSLLNPGAGQYTLKLLDGLNKDVRFTVSGCRLYRGANGYLDRGNTPLSQITWTNNVDAVTGAPITIS